MTSNQLDLMPRFEPPTLSACLLHAAKIGLPDIEANKFHAYYESCGWFVGRKKMVSWHGAMAGWKLRYQERSNHRRELSPNVQAIRNQNELSRVEERIKAIRQSYDGHVDMSVEDRHQLKMLKARKAELLKALGMSV